MGAATITWRLALLQISSTEKRLIEPVHAQEPHQFKDMLPRLSLEFILSHSSPDLAAGRATTHHTDSALQLV
jgi:hypothetical protein